MLCVIVALVIVIGILIVENGRQREKMVTLLEQRMDQYYSEPVQQVDEIEVLQAPVVREQIGYVRDRG
jgi:hypothetical protein